MCARKLLLHAPCSELPVENIFTRQSHNRHMQQAGESNNKNNGQNIYFIYSFSGYNNHLCAEGTEKKITQKTA